MRFEDQKPQGKIVNSLAIRKRERFIEERMQVWQGLLEKSKRGLPLVLDLDESDGTNFTTGQEPLRIDFGAEGHALVYLVKYKEYFKAEIYPAIELVTIDAKGNRTLYPPLLLSGILSTVLGVDGFDEKQKLKQSIESRLAIIPPESIIIEDNPLAKKLVNALTAPKKEINRLMEVNVEGTVESWRKENLNDRLRSWENIFKKADNLLPVCMAYDTDEDTYFYLADEPVKLPLVDGRIILIGKAIRKGTSYSLTPTQTMSTVAQIVPFTNSRGERLDLPPASLDSMMSAEKQFLTDWENPLPSDQRVDFFEQLALIDEKQINWSNLDLANFLSGLVLEGLLTKSFTLSGERLKSLQIEEAASDFGFADKVIRSLFRGGFDEFALLVEPKLFAFDATLTLEQVIVVLANSHAYPSKVNLIEPKFLVATDLDTVHAVTRFLESCGLARSWKRGAEFGVTPALLLGLRRALK